MYHLHWVFYYYNKNYGFFIIITKIIGRINKIIKSFKHQLSEKSVDINNKN